MKNISALKGMLLCSILFVILIPDISYSQYLPPPYNFQAEIMSGNPDQVLMSWDFDPDTTLPFQFFVAMVDSVTVGTTTAQEWQVSLSGFNTHCYSISAFYDVGTSDTAGPLCGPLYPAPYNVSAVFNNDVIPIVDIYWNHDADSVQYFIVERDGYPIGTTTTHYYMDQPPSFINYCYTVTAVYITGNSDPGGPGCSNPNPLLPEMMVDPWLHEEWLPVDVSYMWTTTITNTGDWVLWYNFPGYTSSSSPPGFIQAVAPSISFVPEGNSQSVLISWSSVGYAPGTYYQDLVLIGNDPNNLVEVLPNIMHVGTLTTLTGNIVDASNNEPLYGVEVNAGIHYDQTDTNGYYSFRAPPNTTLDVTYEKPGYEPLIISLTTGDDWTIMVLDTSLIPITDVISWVQAETDCNDPAPAEVSWSPPGSIEELLYDNDFCSDMHFWDFAGGEHAVRFTPVGYPAIVQGGSFYVGRGAYPIGNWLNTPVTVLVYDVGTDGMPGNVLDSTIAIINDYGWVDCYFGYDAQIDSGDFFISIMQENHWPNTPPMGVDNYFSQDNYSYMKPPIGNWDTAGFRNFMIRATIDYPSADGVDYYTIARIDDLDPDIGPQSGTFVILGNVVENQYTDDTFQYLDEGWYAYAVQTVYSSGQSDPFVYSNIIGNGMGNTVDFFAEDCYGNPIENLEVLLSGQDYPYELYNEVDTTPIGIDCVWEGSYDILVIATGFDTVEINTDILADTSFYFTFDSTLYPVSNLWVDTLNYIAHWDAPIDTSNLIYYQVYLDGAYMGSTDTTFWLYSYINNAPFSQYLSCVVARYSCGNSDPVCKDFGGGYLQAPDWITGDSIGDDILLTWYYNDTLGYFDDAIIGFKLYRDSAYFKYIPNVMGQDTFTHLDTNLAPMCYDYHVSAFFDLETYGYLMQFGDSELTGPAEVCLLAGGTMPIFEDWSSGSFGSFWTAESNWRINGQYGNPMPSAEFTWDPVFEDYQFSLTSDFINGVYMDSVKQEYLDGKFILKFDLKLDDNSSSGEEHFKAEVWSDGNWHTVFEADNSIGSFDWTTETIDITSFALGYVYKLRFMAEGESSMNILSWFVDNIEVFHYCASPVDLVWDPIAYNMCIMTWNTPSLDEKATEKGIEGYKLYMSFEGEPYQFLDFTTDTTYTYEFIEYGHYYFYVSALYESCESGGSNEIWIYYNPIGLKDVDGNEGIRIFPNPSDDKLSIESSTDIQSLCLLDLSGRELYCKENIHENQYRLNVSAYDPGVYLLRIDTEKGRVVKKIIIAH